VVPQGQGQAAEASWGEEKAEAEVEAEGEVISSAYWKLTVDAALLERSGRGTEAQGGAVGCVSVC
jgi:hypothetical protein